jgi:hypothetical protein
MQASAYGRRFTEDQLTSFATATNTYLDAVLQQEPLSPTHRAALVEADFPDLNREPLYKYVSDTTWNYISTGSFQLGTAAYYRSTPNMNIRDQREGASFFHLMSGDNQLNISLTSGFNCAIFCGTSHMKGKDHTLMQSKFGKKRLKIEPLSEFVARICQKLNSVRACVHEVVYTDLKNYIAEHDGIERFSEIAGDGNLDHKKLHRLNKTFFATFYKYAFLPSLFSKPTAYKAERERRIVFEMRDDLRTPTIVFKEKSLLDFISLVHE